jgi:hypothetical protein
VSFIDPSSNFTLVSALPHVGFSLPSAEPHALFTLANANITFELIPRINGIIALAPTSSIFTINATWLETPPESSAAASPGQIQFDKADDVSTFALNQGPRSNYTFVYSPPWTGGKVRVDVYVAGSLCQSAVIYSVSPPDSTSNFSCLSSTPANVPALAPDSIPARSVVTWANTSVRCFAVARWAGIPVYSLSLLLFNFSFLNDTIGAITSAGGYRFSWTPPPFGAQSKLFMSWSNGTAISDLWAIASSDQAADATSEFLCSMNPFYDLRGMPAAAAALPGSLIFSASSNFTCLVTLRIHNVPIWSHLPPANISFQMFPSSGGSISAAPPSGKFGTQYPFKYSPLLPTGQYTAMMFAGTFNAHNQSMFAVDGPDTTSSFSCFAAGARDGSSFQLEAPSLIIPSSSSLHCNITSRQVGALFATVAGSFSIAVDSPQTAVLHYASPGDSTFSVNQGSLSTFQFIVVPPISGGRFRIVLNTSGLVIQQLVVYVTDAQTTAIGYLDDTSHFNATVAPNAVAVQHSLADLPANAHLFPTNATLLLDVYAAMNHQPVHTLSASNVSFRLVAQNGANRTDAGSVDLAAMVSRPTAGLASRLTCTYTPPALGGLVNITLLVNQRPAGFVLAYAVHAPTLSLLLPDATSVVAFDVGASQSPVVGTFPGGASGRNDSIIVAAGSAVVVVFTPMALNQRTRVLTADVFEVSARSEFASLSSSLSATPLTSSEPCFPDKLEYTFVVPALNSSRSSVNATLHGVFSRSLDIIGIQAPDLSSAFACASSSPTEDVSAFFPSGVAPADGIAMDSTSRLICTLDARFATKPVSLLAPHVFDIRAVLMGVAATNVSNPTSIGSLDFHEPGDSMLASNAAYQSTFFFNFAPVLESRNFSLTLMVNGSAGQVLNVYCVGMLAFHLIYYFFLPRLPFDAKQHAQPELGF